MRKIFFLIFGTFIIAQTTFAQKDNYTREALQAMSKEELAKILTTKTVELVNVLPWIAFEREKKNYGLADAGNNLGMMKGINGGQATLVNSINTSMPKLLLNRDSSNLIDAIMQTQEILDKFQPKNNLK